MPSSGEVEEQGNKQGGIPQAQEAMFSRVVRSTASTEDFGAVRSDDEPVDVSILVELKDSRHQTPEVVAPVPATGAEPAEGSYQARTQGSAVENDMRVAPPATPSMRRPKPHLKASVSEEATEGCVTAVSSTTPRGRATSKRRSTSNISQTGSQTSELTVSVQQVPSPASTHRFSASHQARAQPQHKASWAGDVYDFLSMIPNEAGAQELLHHRNLEFALAQRVATAQPKHLGSVDVVIQDLANATVREIVGVVESLLDRLLLEKKLDTIRNIVAELMTSDVKATLATGHEQLRQREFGRIDGELRRLAAEGVAAAAAHEERLGAERDLRSAQSALQAGLEERCRRLEARLAGIEREMVPRTEMHSHLAAAACEAGELSGRVTRAEEHVSQLGASLRAFEGRCAEELATKLGLAAAEERLGGDVDAARNEAATGLQALREHAAAAVDVGELRAALEETTRASEAGLEAVHRDLSVLGAAQQQDREFSEATFETKQRHRDDVEGLQRQAEAIAQTLHGQLGRLAESAATKRQLEQMRSATQATLVSLQQALSGTSRDLKKSTEELETLQELCRDTLATREYAYETAKDLAHRAAQNSDDRELVAQLRREFEEERERARQTLRQVQAIRRDLGDMVEVLHETREKGSDLGAVCTRLAQQLEDLDGREAVHWAQAQAAVCRQGHAQDELEASHRALREEFVVHTEVQRGEAEKLRNHSTQRYLEQMDRALDLHRSLEAVAMGHRELHDSVRSIKLPKVLVEQRSDSMC